MSNPNIFTKTFRHLSILPILLLSPAFTGILPADQEKEAAAPANPEPVQKDQEAEAKKVLNQSKNMLLELRSLKAKMRETIVIGKRRFRAVGEYVQGSERKLKLTLEVKVGDSNDPLNGTLLQVCDGQILWSRYEIGEQIRLTRRDVGQILKAVEDSDAIPQNILVAELGLGGIPTLLASIEQNVHFLKSENKTIEGREYLVIEGEWSAEFRKKFTKNGTLPKKLPAHVPDKISIYFDEKTLFPRRILYLKKDYKKELFQPMVMLDFLDVILNAPIEDEDFNYVPADGESPVDITSTYLSKLKKSGKK